MILLALLFSGVRSPGLVDAGSQQQGVPIVDPVLLSQSKTSEPLDYLIYFEEKANLTAAYDLPWEARGWYVYNTLTRQADQSQARVREYLSSQGLTYQSFWAENAILVQASSGEQLRGLLPFTEIAMLQSIPQMTLVEPLPAMEVESAGESRAVSANIARIHADDVWDLGFRGGGIVVGSIDTGVRATHNALADQYRGNRNGSWDHRFNWWDAVNGRKEPYDDHGHGSHVTGIMVGSDGGSNLIGVAPEAERIACKGLSASSGGSGDDLLVCGEFMLAPWDLAGKNANPDLRPHVVNNSWGSCDKTYYAWFEGTIDAWLAAGIYPVFANGNASNCDYPSPPGLNTVMNPARSYHVTAVGSTGLNNGHYATHSNWGPTDSLDTLNPLGNPNLKPQVVAPGVSIRSAISGSDSAYGYWSGTSMSAPHVAGLVALLWGATPRLWGNYVMTETLLSQTAVPVPVPEYGQGRVPNYATGWGEIDALAAVMKSQVELSEKFYLPMFLN